MIHRQFILCSSWIHGIIKSLLTHLEFHYQPFQCNIYPQKVYHFRCHLLFFIDNIDSQYTHNYPWHIKVHNLTPYGLLLHCLFCFNKICIPFSDFFIPIMVLWWFVYLQHVSTDSLNTLVKCNVGLTIYTMVKTIALLYYQY